MAIRLPLPSKAGNTENPVKSEYAEHLFYPLTTTSLRSAALAALLLKYPADKQAALDALVLNPPLLLTEEVIDPPADIPGRPERPILMARLKSKQRSLATREGRARLIHAIAHIEFNAINLALDAVWRFSGMPAQFYIDWLKVAHEEARHFDLLVAHLQDLGHVYGDFPAHDGLWEMVQKTTDDVLARMALVPRTLEARGLDASPPLRAKLQQVGDTVGADILDIILRDEIGHVAIGNHWYRWLCTKRGLDPVLTYAELAHHYQAPALRGPFNLEARRAAGFEEMELEALSGGAITR